MKRVKTIAFPCILLTAIYTLPAHPQRAADDVIAPAQFDFLRKAGPLQLWYNAAETKTGVARWHIPPGINTWNDRHRYAGHFGIHPWEVLGRFAPRNLKSGAAISDSVQIGWIRHYASQLAPSWDEAYAVAVDGSGNVYVTGASTKLPYGLDCLTIKYNAAGAKIWEARYNSPFDGDDFAVGITVDAAGDVYVAGASAGAGTALDYLIIKYNSAGTDEWTARYDGPGHSNDRLSALAVDDSGNVYITGGSAGVADADYATVKYNANGVQQWVARYNGPENQGDGATALALDRSGNVYITGVSYSAGTSGDYATVKYNAAGIELWVARYSNDGESNSDDMATAIAVDANGNSYVTGWSAVAQHAATDYATVKYNSAGVQQWSVRYDGPAHDHDFASAVAVDNSGNIYVTGDSWGQGTFADYVTIKYDAAGKEQWWDRYNGPFSEFDAANAIALDAAGNVYVTGESRSAGSRYAQDDYATIKYSPSGVRQWITRYNGPANGYDQVADLAVDALGNIYVTGRSEASDGDYDFATLKYNSAGTQLWASRYNGLGNSRDYSNHIAIDRAGNVYVTGTSVDPKTEGDYLTIKYNAEGVEKWRARYNGPGNLGNNPTAIKIDHLGNVYLTGSSEGLGTRSDYATIKYNSEGVRQWVARYNAPGNLPDMPVALEVDRAGNVYVTGSAYHTSSGTNTDFTTIKYNLNGEIQWIARYDGPANSVDDPVGLAVDDLGNVYVTGRSIGSNMSSPGPGAPSSDYATIKYNSAGVQRWIARYNGPANSTDAPDAIAIDPFGNVYVSGHSWDPATFYDFATIKYNAYGTEQWVARYNGPGSSSDFVYDLAVDASGNAYVLAHDYTIIKYNPKGGQQWVSRYNRTENEYDYPIGLVLDGLGNIYAAGSSSFSSPGAYHRILKYNSNGIEQWGARFEGSEMKGIAVDFSGNICLTGSTQGSLWSIYTTIKYVQSSPGLIIPNDFSLLQNYPNPFYYATSIRYIVPRSGHVTLTVYNLWGQEVASLVSGEHTTGMYNISWGGENVPSGIYIYRLQGDRFTETKKLVLIK